MNARALTRLPPVRQPFIGVTPRKELVADAIESLREEVHTRHWHPQEIWTPYPERGTVRTKSPARQTIAMIISGIQ